MSLIIETDIGRDPDDFFALCYFIQAGVQIDMICVQPGDPDQISFTKSFIKECGINCPVVSSKKDRNKSSLSMPHIRFAKLMGWDCNGKSDGFGLDYIKDIFQEQTEIFVCGPCTTVGRFSETQTINKLTMQGGYISYEEIEEHGIIPKVKADKFLGKKTVPSFNPGGDKKAMLALLNANIKERRFVSKNLCHTILYDREIHKFVLKRPCQDSIDFMFRKFMDSFLENQPCKAFHDPTAAVCHVHPEIATWVDGSLYYNSGEWGFNIIENGNSKITADVETDMLWKLIRTPWGETVEKM
jgi:pyrimidine-specific ribonucleoside hydrolase